MLRRSDDKIRDPMDAIVMPKKWHHLCIAIDGASNMVTGVAVRICKHFVSQKQIIMRNIPQDGDILESEKIGESDKASVERENFQELKANNCTYLPGNPCTNGAGTSVADLSIWETALSHNEMVGWTACK